jgi:hypothetical protein
MGSIDIDDYDQVGESSEENSSSSSSDDDSNGGVMTPEEGLECDNATFENWARKMNRTIKGLKNAAEGVPLGEDLRTEYEEDIRKIEERLGECRSMRAEVEELKKRRPSNDGGADSGTDGSVGAEASGDDTGQSKRRKMDNDGVPSKSCGDDKNE